MKGFQWPCHIGRKSANNSDPDGTNGTRDPRTCIEGDTGAHLKQAGVCGPKGLGGGQALLQEPQRHGEPPELSPEALLVRFWAQKKKIRSVGMRILTKMKQ